MDEVLGCFEVSGSVMTIEAAASSSLSALTPSISTTAPKHDNRKDWKITNPKGEWVSFPEKFVMTFFGTIQHMQDATIELSSDTNCRMDEEEEDVICQKKNCSNDLLSDQELFGRNTILVPNATLFGIKAVYEFCNQLYDRIVLHKSMVVGKTDLNQENDNNRKKEPSSFSGVDHDGKNNKTDDVDLKDVFLTPSEELETNICRMIGIPFLYDHAHLYRSIIDIADFLEFHLLFKSCQMYFLDIAVNKTEEEIRAYFGLPDDLTIAEKQEITHFGSYVLRM